MKKYVKVLLAFILATALIFTLCPYVCAYEFEGVDVSVWQGNIDFDKVQSDGKSIVYIRAGEGSYADSRFEENADAAENADILYGFYFYVTAKTVAQAQTQARFFASLIEAYDYPCRPAVDYENFGSLSNTQINAIALEFAQTLEDESSVTPLFYSDSSNTINLWDEALTKYPLWVADYTPDDLRTGIWDSYAAFQYSDEGEVDGIDATVDLDRFTGDVIIPDRLPFNDVSGDEWYYPFVYKVYKRSLMNAVAYRSFAPQQTATPAMAVTVMYRADGKDDRNVTIPFTDVVQDSWYDDAVKWAYATGITLGCSDDKFCPDAPISRERLATLFYRYALYLGYDTSARANLSDYPDSSNVSDWALEAMQWAVAEKIIAGIDGYLYPKDTATRAQLAAVTSRFISAN